MKRSFSMILVMLYVNFFVVSPLLAGVASDFFSLNSRFLRISKNNQEQNFALLKSLDSQESKVSDSLLNSPKDLEIVCQRASELAPELRERLIMRMKFAIIQENRQDLTLVLSALQKTVSKRSKPTLNRENMLGIPFRTGTLELSFLFQKRRGEILQCDKEHFVATLDKFHLEVTLDPSDTKKVIAKFTGGANTPPKPIGGRIVTTGNSSKIEADEGTTIQILYLQDGSYKFSSNRFPVTISGKFVD